MGAWGGGGVQNNWTELLSQKSVSVSSVPGPRFTIIPQSVGKLYVLSIPRGITYVIYNNEKDYRLKKKKKKKKKKKTDMQLILANFMHKCIVENIRIQFLFRL